jgi:hypothetical protein
MSRPVLFGKNEMLGPRAELREPGDRQTNLQLSVSARKLDELSFQVFRFEAFHDVDSDFGKHDVIQRSLERNSS